MQLKTAMRHRLTAVRMVLLKSQKITDTGEVVEKRDHLYTVDESVS